MRAAFTVGCLLVAVMASPAVADDMVVSVERVSLEGTTTPVPGIEVAVEAWKTVPGPMAERKLDSVHLGRTDDAGLAHFSQDGAELAERVASLVYDGVTYTSAPITNAGEPVVVRVYDATDSIDALKGRMSVGLDVRDGFLIIDTSLNLSNRSRRTVDTRRMTRGLRVPVALPAVFGGPWETGVIPSDTGPRHVSLRSTPESGRFQFRDGAVFFEGPIVPGRTVNLQARYALPIVDERQDVALTTPVPLDQLMVSTTWTDRVSPRVVPDREFLAVGREPGEAVQRFLRVEPPPAAGEAFVLHVDRLPRPDKVQNQLAVGGGVALFVIFGLSLAALRRRDG